MLIIWQFLTNTKAGRFLSLLVVVLLTVASLVATYEMTTKSYYKSGYEAGLLFAKEAEAKEKKTLKDSYEAELKIAKEENDKAVHTSALERSNTLRVVAGLQQRITEAERKARNSASISFGQAPASGDDPIGLLAELSRGMAADGGELAWYANDTLKRLKNCNTEHDIAVKITKQFQE